MHECKQGTLQHGLCAMHHGQWQERGLPRVAALCTRSRLQLFRVRLAARELEEVGSLRRNTLLGVLHLGLKQSLLYSLLAHFFSEALWWSLSTLRRSWF